MSSRATKQAVAEIKRLDDLDFTYDNIRSIVLRSNEFDGALFDLMEHLFESGDTTLAYRVLLEMQSCIIKARKHQST